MSDDNASNDQPAPVAPPIPAPPEAEPTAEPLTHEERTALAEERALEEKQAKIDADAEVRANDDTVDWDQYPINDPDFE